jgi:hypothetical protein
VGDGYQVGQERDLECRRFEDLVRSQTDVRESKNRANESAKTQASANTKTDDSAIIGKFKGFNEKELEKLSHVVDPGS